MENERFHHRQKFGHGFIAAMFTKASQLPLGTVFP
jgi:hypothetical protein